MTTSDAPLHDAFALLDSGDLDAAVALLDDALRQAEERHGESSLPAARAHNDLGTLLRVAGDDETALRRFERAAALTKDDDSARKEHLTYLLNIGDVLLRSGSLEDAEDAIRRSLQGRRELYGPSHPGYAFALEPLAHVLLRQAKHDAALETIEEAVANFRHHAHPRLATALAVRAEVLAALGSDTCTLEGASELPDELLPAVAQALHARLIDGEPRQLERVLYELLPLLEERLGRAHEVTLETWSAVANLEADGGDPVRRREAIARVLAALEESGDGYGALEACLGLALAFVDDGDEKSARRAYEDARARAVALEDDAALAQVLRNLGLFLQDAAAHDARRALEEAVEAAVRCADDVLVGRCQAALGVVLAHEGSQSAEAVLTEAVLRLPPEHMDALVARAHQDALHSGRPCGCGEVDVALAQALREMVQLRVPNGLVADVTLVPDDDEELSLEVELTREPSPREQELLDEVVRAAHRKLRERALRGG